MQMDLTLKKKMIVLCHHWNMGGWGGEAVEKKQDFPKRLNFSGLCLDLWMCSRVESRVLHRYAHPGTFAVAAQCSRADFNITACRIISIHRPVRAVSLFSGYAGNLSLSCKPLRGDQLQIKTAGNAGRCQDDSKSTLFIIFNLAGAFVLWSRCASFPLPFFKHSSLMCAGSKVTYRIQIGNVMLPEFCISRGSVPVNVAVAPGVINQLRIGCHRLTVYASSVGTFPDVSAHLQVSGTTSFHLWSYPTHPVWCL